jgi:hypothetical protein
MSTEFALGRPRPVRLVLSSLSSSSTSREERIVQRTSVTDDYVLISSLYFRRNKTAANATTDFILLHTATGKPQATFTAFQLSYLVTGTCEILQ